MRPTELHFRSPKERTPDPYFPSITHNGNKLGFKAISPKPNSFGSSDRFRAYELQSKRIGSSVGPGSYMKGGLKFKPLPGACLYKPFYAMNLNSERNYYFIGNHLVSDTIKKRKTSKSESNPKKLVLRYQKSIENSINRNRRLKSCQSWDVTSAINS